MRVDKFGLTDHVTGLPYYEEFVQVASEVIKNTELEAGSCFTVVASDISNFKYVNNIYGYERGNQLLKELVRTVVVENDSCILACRPYTDHVLGLYVSNVKDQQQYQQHIEELTAIFSVRAKKLVPMVTIHVNTGIFMVEDLEEELTSCIDKANLARRASKGDYSKSCLFFEDSMLEKREINARILSIFETLPKEQLLHLYLQPKICVPDKKLVGVEALTRMTDGEGEMISPGVFIPVLEKSGMIVELDMYMMEQVFALLQQWKQEGKALVPISVNLSRMNFYNPVLVEQIIDCFSRYDIPANMVEFEITESVFFDESKQIVDKIRQLRDYGFQISVDDFGIGYSTLHTLGTMPVDTVKLDRGFIQSSIGSTTGLKIVAGLVNIFKQINFDVICEGVETETEERLVVECGCNKIQGFLYDKPLSIADFTAKYM